VRLLSGPAKILILNVGADSRAQPTVGLGFKVLLRMHFNFDVAGSLGFPFGHCYKQYAFFINGLSLSDSYPAGQTKSTFKRGESGLHAVVVALFFGGNNPFLAFDDQQYVVGYGNIEVFGIDPFKLSPDNKIVFGFAQLNGKTFRNFSQKAAYPEIRPAAIKKTVDVSFHFVYFFFFPKSKFRHDETLSYCS
jgi:hypothetical protein